MTDQSRPPGGYAGTPGFSEREERARVAWSSYSDRPADDMTHDFRAGYHRGVIDEARRSEVPAPGARRELTPCGNIVCTGCRVCGCPALGIAPAAPEPQGEPSDAQVAEIEQRVYDQHRGQIAGMAKALVRAGWDAAVEQEGATDA